MSLFPEMLINELLINVVFKTPIKKALNQTQMALIYYQTKIFYKSVCKPITQTFVTVPIYVYYIWMGETLSNMSADAIIDFKDT